MEKQNLACMFYGFAAAWLVLFIYLFALIRRASRSRRELKRLEGGIDKSTGAAR
ncbi:MAG TPA: CcmD family protein [Bryobacteraceae bacterium]|jgi:CcmD family protein|nr:CcmD family protein [Bryobacteraceae bacterium]